MKQVVYGNNINMLMNSIILTNRWNLLIIKAASMMINDDNDDGTAVRANINRGVFL